MAAGAAERQATLQVALKGIVQAEINLTAAERAKKPEDMKTVKVVTDAQTAVATALKAREAAVLNLEKPGDNYTRLTPTYPAASTGRRLALARWITSPDNPLTARVAINHIWLRHFGTPLVPTVFDFGINGKPPTNQPLLDWLAVRTDGERLADEADSSADCDQPDVSTGVMQSSRFQVQVQGSENATLNVEPGTWNLRPIPKTSTTGGPTRAGWRPRSSAMRRCPWPARST